DDKHAGGRTVLTRGVGRDREVAIRISRHVHVAGGIDGYACARIGCPTAKIRREHDLRRGAGPEAHDERGRTRLRYRTDQASYNLTRSATGLWLWRSGRRRKRRWLNAPGNIDIAGRADHRYRTCEWQRLHNYAIRSLKHEQSDE